MKIFDDEYNESHAKIVMSVKSNSINGCEDKEI